MDIDQATLKRYLSYDPTTGLFTRIAAMTGRHADKIGESCGTLNKRRGYVQIQVGGAAHYAHRLAWIYVHGAVPAGKRIDHANRVRSDNRIANLRPATHADNLRHSKVRTDNTSGFKGVWFDAARGQWAACVGRRKLGRFDTLLDAAAARASAARLAFGAFATE